MAKPMTSDEIENELSDLVDNGQFAGHPNGMGIARAAFTIGQDNGQAIILARAESMLGGPIADQQTAQLGRSMATILAWVAAKPRPGSGRMFGGVGATAAGMWQASVMVAEDEKFGGMWSQYQHGETPAEALSKLATWCTEHDAASVHDGDTEPPSTQPAEHHDTEPSTPFEPVPATLSYLESDQ